MAAEEKKLTPQKQGPRQPKRESREEIQTPLYGYPLTKGDSDGNHQKVEDSQDNVTTNQPPSRALCSGFGHPDEGSCLNLDNASPPGWTKSALGTYGMSIFRDDEITEVDRIHGQEAQNNE